MLRVIRSNQTNKILGAFKYRKSMGQNQAQPLRRLHDGKTESPAGKTGSTIAGGRESSVPPASSKGQAKSPPFGSGFERMQGLIDKAYSAVKLGAKTVFVLGSIYLGLRLVTAVRGDALIKPKTGYRPKYVLEVTRFDDRLSSYKESFLQAQGGTEAIKMMKARNALIKEVHLPDDTCDQESLMQLLRIGKELKKTSNQAVMEQKKFRRVLLQAVLADQTKRMKEEIEKAKDAVTGVESTEQQQQQQQKSETDKSDKVTAGDEDRFFPELEPLGLDATPMIEALEHQIKVEVTALRLVMDAISPEFRAKIESGDSAAIAVAFFLKDTVLGLKGPGMGYSKEGMFFDQGLFSSIIAGLPIKRKVFVLKFKGDVFGRQVAKLREEITAVLQEANIERGDEVVIQLDSGGGTVTGYGLGAAQLARIKAAGLKLTVCVDEVAASGGYMMAAVSDKIIASPFAVIGSIGVVTTIPNFSERMHKEGFGVEEITAGKHKRTLTPYKTPSGADRQKVKQELEDIFHLFKAHLSTFRPALKVDKIATGETWLGTDALRLGLVDSLGTADDYLLQQHTQEDCEVLFLRMKKRPPATLGEALMDAENKDHDDDEDGPGFLASLITTSIMNAVSAWLQQNLSIEGSGSGGIGSGDGIGGVLQGMGGMPSNSSSVFGWDFNSHGSTSSNSSKHTGLSSAESSRYRLKKSDSVSLSYADAVAATQPVLRSLEQQKRL